MALHHHRHVLADRDGLGHRHSFLGSDRDRLATVLFFGIKPVILHSIKELTGDSVEEAAICLHDMHKGLDQGIDDVINCWASAEHSGDFA